MSEKVAEETAREAVGRLVSGSVQDQERAGMIPSASAAEPFARKIVAEQVARHEDGSNRNRLRGAAPAPDRISRGDVGENTVSIQRYAGTEATGLTGIADAAPTPDWRLLARLMRLSQASYQHAAPRTPWILRLENAKCAGEMLARALGIHTPGDISSIVADAVIAEVDKSNEERCHRCAGRLGDWRVGGACESCERKRLAATPKITVH